MTGHSQRGLSLIEMLVALAVFAAVSAAAVGLLAIANNGKASIDIVSKEITGLERGRSIIRADLMQIAKREYREPFAAEHTQPFLGGIGGASLVAAEDDERLLMAFVRRGWVNPGAVDPRSSLQRVAYILRNDDIVRRVRPFVDAAPDTPSRDQILFGSVQTVSVEFKREVRWVEDWDATVRDDLPSAVRFVFDHPDFGLIQQDFLVGEGNG